MSQNGPCDISASQTNTQLRQRLEYIQSAAVTHPPGYGFPYVAPQRIQLTCISMSFTTAAQNQAVYKNAVLTSMNKNTFIPTRQQQLTNILNGFTAQGQPSAQYATHNWTYTSSNTRNTPQYSNNTVACQTPLGYITWFYVVTDYLGETIVATGVNGAIYYSIDSGQTWNLSQLPGNGGLGPTPYLTYSRNPGSYVVSMFAQNAVYKSVDGGQTWVYMIDTTTSGITRPSGIVSSDDGAINIYSGVNGTGTTMIKAIATNTLPYPGGYPTRYILDSTLPVYEAPSNYVQFTALTSGNDANILWACGNCNPTFIPFGFFAPIPGYYVWRSDTSGDSWYPGINPDQNWADRIVSPAYPGTDIVLSVVAADASGNRVAVAGYRDPAAPFTPNFWIQPYFEPQSALPPNVSTTFSSANGFAGIVGAYNWYAIAMSQNGLVIAASSAEIPTQRDTGFIYVSTDGGATCTQTSCPVGVWNSIAMSHDGQNIIAVSSVIIEGITVVQGGYILISNNFGVSWMVSNTLLV